MWLLAQWGLQSTSNWRPDRPCLGWRGVHCVCFGGDNTMFCWSWCRRSDKGGPVLLLDSFLTKFINPDDLSVLPQKGRQGSCIEEIGNRKKRRGVELVIWMGTENSRPGFGRGRVFVPSPSRTSVAQISVDEPPIVMWESRDYWGRWIGSWCWLVLICTPIL